MVARFYWKNRTICRKTVALSQYDVNCWYAFELFKAYIYIFIHHIFNSCNSTYLFSPFLLTSHSHGQYTAQSRSIIVCNSSIYFGTNPELKFWEKSKVCNIRHMHALNKTWVNMICPKNGINLFLVEFVCVIAISFGNRLRLILYQY